MGNRYTNINRFMLDKKVREFSKHINGSESILDVGAGGGHYRGYFKGKNYLAVDMCLAQDSYKGLDVACDICALPFKDASVNNIMCIEVIEHSFKPEELLKEISRILKENGRFLLTSPLCWGEHMQPYDYFRFTQFSLSKMLEAAGFRIKKIGPRGGHFTLIGYLISRIPDNISTLQKMPGILRSPLRKILRLFFIYLLSPIFIHLDFLDRKKNTTMGYLCEAEKTVSK